MLPVKNGEYVIIKGEGYVDIPPIEKQTEIHRSKLQFKLDTVTVGNSEMQHLDFAYAASLIRTFLAMTLLFLLLEEESIHQVLTFMLENTKLKPEAFKQKLMQDMKGKRKLF